jgi:2-polyprenyl-3-methyl-5-hydroxy-6-metoxy-1,4-benzoquinol methylase
MNTKQWEQMLLINELNFAKQHNPEYYRWKLTNNYERAVFLKNDPVLPREASRYIWANKNLYGKNILEVGCSTGYGCQFLPNDINYLGLDYDPIIIDVAHDQNWGDNVKFSCTDINQMELAKFDTIIAFEVIEHLDNGIELVERLKQHTKRLLITVPWNEPPGFWGEHHKLHGLNETNFPGFEFNYIDQHGRISDLPVAISQDNHFNLMIARFDRG